MPREKFKHEEHEVMTRELYSDLVKSLRGHIQVTNGNQDHFRNCIRLWRNMVYSLDDLGITEDVSKDDDKSDS